MKSPALKTRDLIRELILFFNKEVPNGLPCLLKGTVKPSPRDRAIYKEAIRERELFLNFQQAHNSQEEVKLTC